MARDRGNTGFEFLTVGEAARHLGVSRLRVRQAVAADLVMGRRDNEGNLRIDLSAAIGRNADLDLSGATVDAPALMDLLFDEVEELRALLNAKDAETRELTLLAGRQSSAIETADRVLEHSERHRIRLRDLLDRALADID